MTAEPARRPDDETEDEEFERSPEDRGTPQRQSEESAREPEDLGTPERDPEDLGTPEHPEDRETAEPEAPAASESISEAASEPATAPDASLTPEAAASAEAAAAAEAAPTDPNLDPDATEAAVAAADAQEVPTTAQAVATIDAATDTPADTSAADRAARRRAVGGALRQVVVAVIGIALLIAGIALGNYLFQTSQADAGSASGPGTSLVDPPPAAQEFIAALAVNDADAVRSSLDREPHLDLMREMERRGIQKVDRIEVLGTSEDGPRSATEILMQFQRQDGISSAINLVILVDGGKIEGFR